MKKLSNLLSASLLLILSLGVMSCSKDKNDDDVELSAASLVGIWDLTKSEYYIDGEKVEYKSEFKISSNIPNTTITSTVSRVGYIEYKDNGIVIFNYITQEYEGVTLANTYEESKEFEYQLSGNKLTFTEIDKTGRGDVDYNSCEVLSFNGKTMTMKSEEDEDEEGHTKYTITVLTKR